MRIRTAGSDMADILTAATLSLRPAQRERRAGTLFVTVAICTLNRAESLRRTLDSVAAMRVSDDLAWELIVVNNNSTDQGTRLSRSIMIAYLCDASLNHSTGIPMREIGR